MAHLCLSAAWDRTEGIGVDVHVHRLTNMWGWHKTRNPEETRVALEAWLPRDKWREINWLLVGFGQTVCPSAGKRCGECQVGLEGLCKAADRAKIAEGRRRVKAESMGFEAKVKVDEGDEVGEVKIKVEEEEDKDVGEETNAVKKEDSE